MGWRSDGGRTALAGYLYQVVGLLGMTAHAHACTGATDSDEWEALLALVRHGDLRHEYLDQDGVLRDLGVSGNDACVFLQFKYSRQVPPPAIGPDELLGIVRRLDAGTTRARGTGQEVTGYALLTNRVLGPASGELQEAVSLGCDHRLLPSRHSERAILKDLRIVPAHHLSSWEEALRRFGRDHGATEAEIESGISTLVGDLVRKTVAGDAAVTMAYLVRAFTGHEAIRPLTAGSVTPVSRQDVTSFFSRLGLRGSPVPRAIVDDVAREAATRALVVLHGNGGCGKSMALWQWAKDLTASSRQPGAFTHLSLASEVRPTWVTEVVCGWAKVPPDAHPRRGDWADDAVARLRTANPGVESPILHLGLDGLDEGGVSIATVSEVLKWFWAEDEAASRESRPPRATLVVTCREKSDPTDRILHLDISGGDYDGPTPAYVSAGHFSVEELRGAVSAAAPDLLEPIDRVLRPVASGEPDRLDGDEVPALVDAAAGPTAPAADGGVVTALRHPAIWGALLELLPAQRRAAVLGEPAAVRELVLAFIHRFAQKVARRREFDRPELEHVLHAVARECRSDGRDVHSLAEGWIGPACSTGTVTEVTARALHREACSYGLVLRESPGRWRWNHPLIGDILADMEPS